MSGFLPIAGWLPRYDRRFLRMARRAGLLDRLGEDRVFHTVEEAVEALSRAA